MSWSTRVAACVAVACGLALFGAGAPAGAEDRGGEPLAAAWRETLARSPRPATWAARRVDFERALQADPPAERAALAADQLSTLRAEIRAARAMPRRLKRLGPGCIGAALRDCRVLARGRLDIPNGESLHWRIQRGFTPEEGVRGGVVLMQRAAGGYATVAWSFEGYEWKPPVVSRHGDATLVAVAGTRPGSGQGNADLLLRKDGARWTDVELESWKDELARALPEGRDIRRGVAYDFATLTARSPLWSAADADCCPTGGSVRARLALSARRLSIAGFEIAGASSKPRSARGGAQAGRLGQSPYT